MKATDTCSTQKSSQRHLREEWEARPSGSAQAGTGCGSRGGALLARAAHMVGVDVPQQPKQCARTKER